MTLTLPQAMQSAAVAYQRGDWAEAERLCRAVLNANGDHFAALHLLGIIAAQTRRTQQAVGLISRAVSTNPKDRVAHSNLANALRELKRYPEALESYERALALNPDVPEAHNNRGIALGELKRHADALTSYDRAIALRPGFPEPHNNRGIALGNLGRHAEALESCDRAIALKPDYAEAHNNRGISLHGLNRHAEALESYDRAIALKPDYAEAHYNRGKALRDLNRSAEALESYNRAVALRPDYAEAYFNRGNALRDLIRRADALESYEHAIALKPDLAEAHHNRGIALHDLKRHAAALESYERAIALKPDYAKAWNNRANSLFELKRHAEALRSCGRAIALDPDYAEAHHNRGMLLHGLNHHMEALENYDRAIALKPDSAEAHHNRANTLRDLNRHAEALESHERALHLKPDQPFLYGDWLVTRMQICAWDDVAKAVAGLNAKIEVRERTSPPFFVLATPSSLAIQRAAAETWVQANHPANHALPAIPKRPRHDRIRIGYFSADFREHAISFLVAELFERHAKSRFHLTAFSFGPDTQDATRRRVAAAFDEFIDVRSQSDYDVATLARKLEIDIAVDLTGFTRYCRPGIFALRAAPIQVNYLGYPGTMGAEYIDYLIADSTLIPEAHQRDYAEKIAYLPESYQANDSRRPISDKAFTREESGLPQTGVVFCCFNNNYKIVPATFDRWMSILKQVDGSVLWLIQDNEQAATNLRREAVVRGVDAGRLIFAPRMALAEHLARHRLADLFLDTLPYNAHTTASDALWAGLPVLTCLGETFAGRVAASLLTAIRLPELITSTPDEYENLAIALATNPERLKQAREKLARNRLTTPLFDIRQYTEHIEAAYTMMYERHQAGLPPVHIVVRA